MLTRIIQTLRLLSALCLSVLLLVVLVVILDTKLQWNAVWASSLSTFLLAWTIMLGGALAYAEKKHLGLDLVVEKFDPNTRLAAHRLGHAIVFFFSMLIMLLGGWQLTSLRWEMEQTIPSLGISQAWFYLSLPVAGVIIALTAVGHLASEKTAEPNNAD